MKTVSSLLRDSTWWRWSTAVGCARMPPAMAALALIFAGQYVSGSYAIGAVLSGCYAGGEAVAAPWRGRTLDQCPPARRAGLMRTSLLLSALVLGLLAGAVWTRQPVIVLVALTVLSAVLAAGVPGGYRALLTELIDEERLLRAFSWDATILEIEWLLAPVVVSLAMLSGRPALPVAAMACWALSAALLTSLLPRGWHTESPDDGADIGAGQRAWTHPAAWPTYLTSAALGIGEGGLIAALPALLVALHSSASGAGLFAAVLALGSVIGGMSLAAFATRLPGRTPQQADVVLLLMCLLCAPAIVVSSSPWLLLPLLAGGLFIAPVNALRSQALEKALPPALRSEGYSIQYGANVLGTAAGALLIASFVGVSPRLAVAVVLVIPAVVAVTSLAGRYLRPEPRAE